MKEDILLQIPGCIVHLANASELLELVSGDFKLVKVSSDDNVTLAILDKDGDSLVYKVTFYDEEGDVFKKLEILEDLMRENFCLLSLSKTNNEIDWKEFSPKAGEYKSVVAKAIAEGTGHIIKGIFTSETPWKASESIGATVLDGEDMISGWMMAHVLKSKLGKALLSTAPGEILLASLDSFDKILGAAEAAEIQTHSATSTAASKLVSKSFGEKAGKTTGKVLETTGSLGRKAWKIQKAMDPSLSMISGVVKNAPRE
ncbi:hypothetical protein Bca4012_066895 [Brassica carinata]